MYEATAASSQNSSLTRFLGGNDAFSSFAVDVRRAAVNSQPTDFLAG